MLENFLIAFAIPVLLAVVPSIWRRLKTLLKAVAGRQVNYNNGIEKESLRITNNNLIFISHRTTEKAVADMLLYFLTTTGIPRNLIQCSSLPGNDVKEKISPEVRMWIRRSAVNIAILSSDYYNSAYCLNEAGILWYLDSVPVIPIAF